MCGIFGYSGKQQNAAELVLNGLKLLEYRGYDSWGIAVKIGPVLNIEKHVGKIGDGAVSLPKSNLGIGHTRWATHGGVTEKNAHPHLDCTKKIAVLHNGIIENYAEIKKELIDQGHTFISETDTEVVPHLIEEYHKTRGYAASVRDAFARLHGMNAIVVALSESSEIIAAKNGSPLVVGVGSDGLYIASDISGIVSHTKKVLYIRDSEMVILGQDIQLVSLPKGQKITPNFETIDWEVERFDKGNFPHFMLKEIYEQPTVIRNIATNYQDQIGALSQLVNRAKGTFFIAAGTAYNACLAGTYLFSKIARKHINTTYASEFNYLEDFLTRESLIVAVSQSGETVDIIEPLNHIKEKGSTIVALTNVIGSTIYRMADYKVLLGAGPEKAVASTKAYIAKLAVFISLSFSLIGQENIAKTHLLESASEIERLLGEREIEKIKQIARRLSRVSFIYTIGRGISYATALETALKIKEVTYIHTEGLAGGELKHGPIALVETGTPCIVFAPLDETYDAILSNATEIKSRGGYIIGVSPVRAEVFDEWIEVRDALECSILTQIVPMQVLAYFIAVEKKLDPDKPRNLAKSVTVK